MHYIWQNQSMERLKNAEKYVFYLLIYFLYTFIALEIIELLYAFVKALIEISDEDRLFLDTHQTAAVIPVFFMILIALEMIDTLRMYMKDHTLQAQGILVIGLIAVARKVLIADLAHGDPMISFGLSSLVLTLAIAYYLVRKAGQEKGSKE